MKIRNKISSFASIGLLTASVAISSAQAELYIGGLAGLGKDSYSDQPSWVLGANAGTQILGTFRLGLYYHTLRITQKGVLGSTYGRRFHLGGLDVGAYLPVLLTGLYGGVKLGLINVDGATADGISVPGSTQTNLGFTLGYDYKFMPGISFGLEGNLMGAAGVLYSLLGTAKLWL